ncbi:capsule polysaccharide transporter [Paralimibaculum aggregatum]|uniref:Capsule polysaccharide transporter n=1 Tax=Paralimibaculum aggregatum TaxID=3036245 RepID=A0ABQ6LKJ5_9RHOB|nr:hypothetical protein [Limibaculum sp. NKW23]GMG80815.1 capsule polysaccharide transporter [Limibaculum sp. NKW23]
MSAQPVIRLAPPGRRGRRAPDPAPEVEIDAGPAATGSGPGPGAEAGMAPPIAAPMPPRARPRRVNWPAVISFALIVVLPVVVIGTYYYRHAADQFTATARFTLRETRARPLGFEAAEGAPERIGSGLATETVSHFTHVAASYLESRALLADLGAVLDVDAMFRRPEADFWARMPEGLPAEARFDYWRERVRVAVDGPSGIVSLQIRAFRPEDALALADAAVARAEALVNALSLRQKADAVARAEAEAAESERRLQASIAALSAFRDREGLLDPGQEGAETVRLLSQLTTERIRLESELRVLDRVVDGDAARARALRTRLASITGDIAQLRDQLGSGAAADASLAAALGRFEALEIRRRFAAKLYGLAQTRRINAEIDRARQSVFLNLFDPAQRPERSDHPRRAAFTLLAFLGLSAGWAILALIWASVADHRLDRRG